jgi:hypothetical protein
MSGIGLPALAAAAGPGHATYLVLAALGGLGFPEIAAMLVIAGFWAVPVIVILLGIRLAATGRSKASVVASKPCRHCGQQIPDIGAFCPLCGQRSV